MAIKIVIADDHQLFRSGIEALLKTNPDFEVIKGVEDKESLMKILDSHEVEVVLLDISLPSVSGLDILSDIQRLYPAMHCVMLTMHEEIQYVKESLRKGAAGYLLKDTGEKELFEAIYSVCAGKKYFKNKISDLLIEDMTKPGAGNSILSDREIEIVRMVADGKITKEIADKLYISVRTVETHRSRILKKLGATNTSEMIKEAYRRKLI